MDPGAILITSSVVIMFIALITVSYKTGFVSYSMLSVTRKDQPRFKIRKDKIGRFLWIIVGVFLLNIVYGIIVVQGIREMEAVLMVSLFNTIVIGYGLSFWVLVAEKPNGKSR